MFRIVPVLDAKKLAARNKVSYEALVDRQKSATNKGNAAEVELNHA